LICNIGPGMLAQAIAPFFMEKIPFAVKIIFVSVCMSASFLIIYFCHNLPGSFLYVLLAIVISSISCSFGEITFMALSSYYHRNVVSLYSSGTGGAGIFGSAFYIFLGDVLHIENMKILLYASPIPLLILLSYFFVRERDTRREMKNQLSDSAPMSGGNIQSNSKLALTSQQKLRLQKRLFKYSGPLFLVYISEYVINNSIIPVASFPNDPFYGREYRYYQFIYQVGVFISRSSVNIIQIRNIWCLSYLQFINTAFLFAVTYLNFIPSIYIIFAIILYEGLIGGGVYVNSFYLLAEEIEPEIKEYCMSAVSFWYSCGILVAGFAGLGIGTWLAQNRHY